MAAFKLDKDKFIATSAILVLVGILGTWIGKRILHRMSQDQFRYLVLLLILGVGIANVVSNLNCFG